MNYYIMREGEIESYNPCTAAGDEWDGQNSVAVYAPSKTEACSIAHDYDSGELAVANVWCDSCGSAHAAVQAKRI